MAAIIIDMDGTLADSFDYVTEFLAHEAGLGKLTGEQRQSLRGLSMVGIAKQLGFKWWQGPFLLLKGQRRMRRTIKDLNSFAGMPDLVRKLHQEGHELFIVSTNSLRNIKLFLHHHRIHKYFLEIYGGVGMFGKPAALRQLLREHQLEVGNSVYVGDELRDVEAAKTIGMRAIAVSWGFASRDQLAAAKPTGLADTPDQLMRLLEEI